MGDAAAVLSNMTPSSAAKIIEYLEPRTAAGVFEKLPPLTTAQIFSFLPKEDADAILSLMPPHLLQALQTAAMLNTFGKDTCSSSEHVQGNLELTLGDDSKELLVTGQVSQASFGGGFRALPDASDSLRRARHRSHSQTGRLHCNLPSFQGGWPGTGPRHRVRSDGFPHND